MTPPRRSKAAACQNCASGTGPGADAQRAGGQHQRQGRHQADEPGAQRARGRAQLAHEDEAPGHHQRDGHRVAQSAEDEARGANGPVAQRPAGPVHVGDPAEEDADRDQREGEDVDVVGLERHRRQRRTARQQRATRPRRG
jgi:hypothetical protein